MGTWPSLQARSRLSVLYAGRWKADRLPRRLVIAEAEIFEDPTLLAEYGLSKLGYESIKLKQLSADGTTQYGLLLRPIV